MTFATLCTITVLSIVMVFLSFVLIYYNSRGNIEIKILKIRKIETGLVYSNFFFEIFYFSKTKKEQSAVIIDQLLREEFDSVYSVYRDNNDNLSQIIKSVTKKAEGEANCEIVKIKTKVLVTQFHDWPKEVFSTN